MPVEIPLPRHAAHPKYRLDRVRLQIFVYRKAGTSAEEFQEYWRNEHATLFAHLPIVKKNLLKYEQIHRLDDADLGALGKSTVDYDGFAIYDATSMEKIKEVFEDKEYLETVVPDEENFMDRSKARVFPSRIVDIFDEPT